MKEKVILVTGASSGLGKMCANYLSKKGYRVYGTYRKTIKPQSDESYLHWIHMDVDDSTTVEKGIQQILDHEDRVDVVINSAGWGISGAIEEVPLTQTKQLFESNVFGPLRVIQTILPQMRKQKKGLIINISSIGGVLGLPFQGIYSATKFAVEGMTEALRMEVKSFGVSVVLVEPGDFKTNFTANRKKHISSDKSVYQTRQLAAESVFEHDETHGCDPLLLARLIERIITKPHPRLRYRVGPSSQKFIAALKGVVPDRCVQWILMKYYKLI